MNYWASDMEAFEYSALPARVIFGFGTLPRVTDELNALGRKRAFVLSDPHHAAAGAARLMRALGKLGVQLSTDAVMHTPVDVTERVMAKLVACDADCLVSLGGGSTIGLGKALALRTDLPQIVLPTTYAGSEATPILGETHEGQKSTIRSMKVLPEVIIYDVELTYGLPPGLSLVSGINAIAHAVEALYAREANPVISNLAEQGIAALGRALPRIVSDPGRSRCPIRRPVRSLGLRIVPRSGRDVAPSQAMSRSWRNLRSSARRDPHRDPAACGRVQCRRRAGRPRSCRARTWRA